MKPYNTLIAVIIIFCFSCSTDDNSTIEPNDNPLTQIEYFGNLDDLSHNDALNNMNNEYAENLRVRLYNLKAYMSSNKERLKIYDWHDEDTYLLSESDTINASNSIQSFDGTHYRQISQYNDRDYFWKTDIWFLFSGIADSVSQSNNHAEGYHLYLPSSVDAFRDNINWLRRNDSLDLSIKRTSFYYGRKDEQLSINLITKTGNYSLFDQDENTLYYYIWDENGNGNLTQTEYGWNDEIIDEHYFSW